MSLMKRKREKINKGERREYFNGKEREKLNKLFFFYIALDLQCIAIDGYAR